MTIQQKKGVLINIAYWSVIAAAVYLVFQYLLPISVPFILGILIAYWVVWISRKLRCGNKFVRLGLAMLIYGIVGTAVTVLVIRGVTAISDLVRWLPQMYEMKLYPFVTVCYDWSIRQIQSLDPTLVAALEMLADSLLSFLKSLISKVSSLTMNLVSGVATGIPSLILSLLAMIFSTVFVVVDYDRIRLFASENIPAAAKNVLKKVRVYLTDTLLVVIRSYALIMLLTFTELSILFSLFGINSAVLKASLIALLDILPILGTGGIMIPWAIISLVLGYTELGIKLLVIYVIVTVVRNYVEPKIVGTQLGLHPIITLVSMFIGLRLFGFWGLFGLPVGISFLWKERMGENVSRQE